MTVDSELPAGCKRARYSNMPGRPPLYSILHTLGPTKSLNSSYVDLLHREDRIYLCRTDETLGQCQCNAGPAYTPDPINILILCHVYVMYMSGCLVSS